MWPRMKPSRSSGVGGRWAVLIPKNASMMPTLVRATEASNSRLPVVATMVWPSAENPRE